MIYQFLKGTHLFSFFLLFFASSLFNFPHFSESDIPDNSYFESTEKDKIKDIVTADEYLVGNWSGMDMLACRINSRIYMDIDDDGTTDKMFLYKNGNAEDEYLVGDWDGDGRDNIAVRRGNRILMDTDFDKTHNIEQSYGRLSAVDEYLVGDWDGDGRDNIAVRTGNKILMDTDFDKTHNLEQTYGIGNAEDEYL